MESTTDFETGWTTILFYPDEKVIIPAGYRVIEWTDPSYYKGMLNPGSVTIKPIEVQKDSDNEARA